MNAISPLPPAELEECRARHLAVCQELIDLGMKLTRRAAAQAIEAAEAPTPEPDEHPAPQRDHNLAFARLSRSVRQSVTLEAQIVVNAFARPGSIQPGPHACTEDELDEIRAVLDRDAINHAFEGVIQTHPDRRQIAEILPRIIEGSFAAFPDHPLPTHFAHICRKVGVTPDGTTLPPHLTERLAPSSQGLAWPNPSPPDRWPIHPPG